MSGDNDRSPQFVDTNVLVYAHDFSAGEKRDIAANLLEGLWATRHGRISVQVLQEFFVVATSKVRVPLPVQVAGQIVTRYADWRVHSPVAADVIRAIDIKKRYRISFWDAMIVQSAIQLECSTIWSEDLASEQVYEGVTVKNPFASSKRETSS